MVRVTGRTEELPGISEFCSSKIKGLDVQRDRQHTSCPSIFLSAEEICDSWKGAMLSARLKSASIQPTHLTRGVDIPRRDAMVERAIGHPAGGVGRTVERRSEPLPGERML